MAIKCSNIILMIYSAVLRLGYYIFVYCLSLDIGNASVFHVHSHFDINASQNICFLDIKDLICF